MYQHQVLRPPPLPPLVVFLPLVEEDIRPNQTEFWRQKSTKLGAKTATWGKISPWFKKIRRGVYKRRWHLADYKTRGEFHRLKTTKYHRKRYNVH
jgi:hypothetical protein